MNVSDMSELWQQTLGWQPNELQSHQLQQLYQLLLVSNRQLNLTRITEPQNFWEKHLWDSLRGIIAWLSEPAASAMPATAQVIDIGTGGGFPGVPVAIAQPQWQLTLLDSTHKKMAFLASLVSQLNLPHARTITGRAEQLGQDATYRERYDLALIRAVATAPVCAEYALPLLKQGGLAILYRGQWTTEEQDALEAAAQQLGGKLETVDAFTTPLSQGTRHCIHLRKVALTPAKFPRPVGMPTQKPL